jgi:hypothetical protein
LALEVEVRSSEGLLGMSEEFDLPRLFWIEAEYRGVLKKAERDWLRALIEDIETGRLEGLEMWRQFHASKGEN